MITLKMQQALLEAQAEGLVTTGRREDARGRVSRHAPSTLRALADRGLARIEHLPTGGITARLTQDGEHTVVLLESGNPFLVSLALRDR